MEELRDYLEALIGRFRQQPIAYQEKLVEIQRAGNERAASADEWSPHQLIAHVLAADRYALQPRLRRIIEEDQPDLPNWDEEAWMADSYQPEVELLKQLEEWQVQRADLAQVMADLELTGWNRSGKHPLRGERTLLWWLEYAVNHADDHWNQLAEILAGLQGD